MWAISFGTECGVCQSPVWFKKAWFVNYRWIGRSSYMLCKKCVVLELL